MSILDKLSRTSTHDSGRTAQRNTLKKELIGAANRKTVHF